MNSSIWRITFPSLTFLLATFPLSICHAADPITLTLETKDSEGNEVGRIIVKNADDDNKDGISDLNQSPVAGETNLRKLTITWRVNGVAVFLKKGTNGEKVRIWKDSNKMKQITFNNTDNKFFASQQEVFVEGIDPSVATDDIELFANFDNKDDKKGSTKLTVLWVDSWEFRQKNTEAWHADFVPTVDPRNLEVDPKDAKTGRHIYNDRLGHGLEIRGSVKPSDFAKNFMAIHRAVQFCRYSDQTNGNTEEDKRSFATNNHLARIRGMADDDTCINCNQLDPQANGARGFIYDWDNSGVGNNSIINTIKRGRKNFVQWPRFGSERAGELAFWSQYISAKAVANPPQNRLVDLPLENSFNGDNSDLGTGLTVATFKTNLSFDLKSASCTSGLAIANAALPGGQVGVIYAQALEATGGFSPFTWSIKNGNLPDGLTLDAATGNITGNPAKAITFNFTINLKDAATPTAGTVDKAFSITIAAAGGGKAPTQAQQSQIPGTLVASTDATLAAQVIYLLPGLESDDEVLRSQAMLDFRQIASRQNEAPDEFATIEDAMMNSVASLIQSYDLNDRKKAYHQIEVLADLKSEKAIPLLVANLTFRNPYVTVYTRGPMSYEDPEPKDLPVFVALLQIGVTVIDPVFQRAISEDDHLIHAAFAEMLMHYYQFKGALDWIIAMEAKSNLSGLQLSRLEAVRHIVESYR